MPACLTESVCVESATLSSQLCLHWLKHWLRANREDREFGTLWIALAQRG